MRVVRIASRNVPSPFLLYFFFLEREGRAFHATDFYEIPKNYDYANSIPRAYLAYTLPRFRLIGNS